MKYYSKITKRISKKFIKHSIRDRTKDRKIKLISRKKRVSSNLSPYNSNEFLIMNQSTPFYDEEDEEDFFMSQKSELTDLDKGLKEIKGIEYVYEKFDSTRDESEIINDLFSELDEQLEENLIEKPKK